ncbi:MAG: prepilin-type N-terminal cleavage/methylation domain-containing protein [Chthoniobacterales bacterium]
MFTARVDAARRRGFTLLEITLAVAILALMSLSIYRFVIANLTVIRVSSQESEADARYSGFLNLLTAQWQNLPSGSGALTGEPFVLEERPRDEISWVCGPGPGLLTRYASGDYRVNMRLRRIGGKSDQMEIGFLRRPKGDASNATEHETWIPLLFDVRTLQVRYFDPRLNSWVNKWTDTASLPRLIKVAIGRPDRTQPWEAIVALGRTPL